MYNVPPCTYEMEGIPICILIFVFVRVNRMVQKYVVRFPNVQTMGHWDNLLDHYVFMEIGGWPKLCK